MSGRHISPYLVQKCRPGILLLFFVLIYGASYGQSSLTGRVRDTTFKKDCSLAVVALLESDSTLVRYTRCRKDGSFFFRDIAPGNYRLLVTHPSYSDYSSTIIVRSGGVTDLGVLPLPPRADTLTPVIVTPRSLSPLLRGDTIEYNTAYVRLRVNATVEELLHRLPGVQVDPDGNITVNGQKIEKLLVDGKEFLGGDPTIVTRNFNGDMIGKVQVLDKKSRQAEFTGVDDGRRTKTLNLVLKEDSKRGELLKVEAGGDPQGYYNAGGLLGAFKGSMQLAVLAMTANNGASNFIGDAGGMSSGLYIEGKDGDALGASAGAGIPRVAGGGIHYANDWKANEDHIAGDYQFGSMTTYPFSFSVSRQTLPDTIYIQQQHSNSENTQTQHGLNASYEHISDSLSAYNLSVGGASTQGHNVYNSSGSSSFNDTLVNSSQRTIRSDVQGQSFGSNVMWRIRARRKKERIFSITTGIGHLENVTKGFLYSLNNFYRPGGNPLGADTTDQRKDISSNNLTLNGSISFTEPLKKGTVLALSYGLTYNSSRSIQSTYNRGDGKYDAYVDSLSNHYLNNVLTQRVTANLQTNTRYLTYTIGGDMLHYDYKQTDVLKSSALRYQYLGFAPRIGARINIRPQKIISVDYNGSTHQPSITQLQPVQNNNDPLHITLGNPDLHGGFSHHFGLRYASFFHGAFTAGFDYNLTSSGISTRTYTDSLGRQISQAVNVHGAHDINVLISCNRSIKPINLNVGITSNLSYVRNVNYVNQYLSRNDNYVAGTRMIVSKFVPDKYSLILNANLAYIYSMSSINAARPVHYWSQGYNGQLSIFPIPALEIGTIAIYSWRQRLDNFETRNSTLLWNAYIGKSLIKNQLTIRWQINDILGQNAGISRTSTANQTSESVVNVLGRYWMLSATWRFVHHRKMD